MRYDLYILRYAPKGNPQKNMKNMDNIEYIGERIIRDTLTFPKAKWCLQSLYGPDISKTKEEREEFYEGLQNLVAQIPKDAFLVTIGDMNARIGSIPVPGVKKLFNESEMDENGDLLTKVCSMNSLRINNTFFKHK